MTRISGLAASTVVIVVTVLVLLTGCTAPAVATGPRPITSDEAQLLAVVRFKNFDAGTRTISTSLHDAGTPLTLSGWVDYSSGIGYAELADSGSPADLLLWNDTTLAALPFSSATTAPLPPPDTSPTLSDLWQTTSLTAHGALHPLLAILVTLGNDRPDNPLLLRQGGALWLRTDTIGSTPVTVFAGPTNSSTTSSTPNSSVNPDASNTRYWVDKSGLLLRLEVRLGTDWVTVDFGSSSVQIADPFALVQ